jgi:ABC-2 type transport system ATP-binding protein
MEHTIRVEDLTRVYVSETGFLRRVRREVTALAGISFTVSRGEIFGLLGPNGAGKTTTIKILTTLLLPTQGRVEVLGVDVARHPARVRPRINVVFGGERALYWRLTGRENLQYFADLYRVPPGRQKGLIEELLDLAGLTQAADRRVETYSKGMKQRLSIVRALVNDPEVLFLDEPTIGLDPVGAQGVREFIAALAHRGTTIVLTTHYMFEAELLCRRIAILNHGRIIALDTPAALKRLTVGLSVVEALTEGLTPEDLDRIRALPTVTSLEQVSLGPRILLQMPTETPEVAAEALRECLADRIVDLRWREATLEDAYLRLVGGKVGSA